MLRTWVPFSLFKILWLHIAEIVGRMYLAYSTGFSFCSLNFNSTRHARVHSSLCNTLQKKITEKHDQLCSSYCSVIQNGETIHCIVSVLGMVQINTVLPVPVSYPARVFSWYPDLTGTSQYWICSNTTVNRIKSLIFL